MTSEPDSTPRRRPPTIDLTATEVEAQKPAGTRQSGTAEPTAEAATSNNKQDAAGPGTARPRSPIVPAIGGAAVGAVVIIAIAAGFWLTGYVPSGLLPAPASAPAAAPAQATSSPASPAMTDIATQLKQIQGEIQAQQPAQAVASRVTAAEAAAKAQADSLVALNRRVDEIAAAAQTAVAQAKDASAQAKAASAQAQSASAQAKAASDAAANTADAAKNAAQPTVSPSDLDALAARVAALESTIKMLSGDVAQQSSGANDRAARLTLATEALRAAVERGAPFAAELAAVRRLGVDQSATAPLEPFAAVGVATAAALAQQLAAVLPAVRQAAEPAPDNGSFIGRLESHAQRLVRITPVDAPAGDDPAAVMARLEVDAAHGDIAAARADIAKLPAAAQSVAAPWAQKAQARDAAIAATRQIAANALTALGKPASQ
jgi:hypothetical protein